MTNPWATKDNCTVCNVHKESVFYGNGGLACEDCLSKIKGLSTYHLNSDSIDGILSVLCLDNRLRKYLENFQFKVKNQELDIDPKTDKNQNLATMNRADMCKTIQKLFDK